MAVSSAQRESVVVVGLGYVGMPSAALMAEAGHAVLGVDTNESLLAQLREGRCPLIEPGVAEIVERALASGRLRVAAKAEPANVFIICVPTPITENKHADLTMVAAAARATAPFLKRGDMLVLESTSPVGTTESIVAAAVQQAGLDPREDVDVCYCPERVFPGNTVREIVENDRVVGGLTPRAAARAKTFYEGFCKGTAYTVSAAEAEFAKLMENTYRDVNIALANTFAHVAESAGIDVSKVIAVANRHPRVNVHTPGPGVGGHCIPVDPWFLIESFPDETQMLLQARRINDGQPAFLLDRAESLGLTRGSKVAILGAAYRGDIEDARDSPTELLIELLAARGYAWTVHDPFVTHFKLHSGHAPNLTADLREAVAGAVALFVMTDHTAYRGLGPADMGDVRPTVVIDGRRLLDADAFVRAGAIVAPVGGPVARPAASPRRRAGDQSPA